MLYYLTLVGDIYTGRKEVRQNRLKTKTGRTRNKGADGDKITLNKGE